MGTRGGSPYDSTDGVAKVEQCFRDQSLDGSIVIGGNGSLTVTSWLFRDTGLPLLGVPQTVDNDVFGTDATFDSHTAVQIASVSWSEVVDKARPIDMDLFHEIGDVFFGEIIFRRRQEIAAGCLRPVRGSHTPLMVGRSMNRPHGAIHWSVPGPR